MRGAQGGGSGRIARKIGKSEQMRGKQIWNRGRKGIDGARKKTG